MIYTTENLDIFPNGTTVYLVVTAFIHNNFGFVSIIIYSRVSFTTWIIPVISAASNRKEKPSIWSTLSVCILEFLGPHLLFKLNRDQQK